MKTLFMYMKIQNQEIWANLAVLSSGNFIDPVISCLLEQIK